MATKNSINNKTGSLAIDPGASGDSFVQYDINGTGEFRVGVDDSDSDKFKISQGSALGANDAFIVTGSGEITKPLQPAFLAKPSAPLVNVTGDGTVYTVVWGTEIFDQSGDFDGTSTFTAPITGRYIFSFGFFFQQVETAQTQGLIELVTSNRTYKSSVSDYGNLSDVGVSLAYGAESLTVQCDMDASDTAQAKVTISNGTKSVDIFDTRSYFSGALVC